LGKAGADHPYCAIRTRKIPREQTTTKRRDRMEGKGRVREKKERTKKKKKFGEGKGNLLDVVKGSATCGNFVVISLVTTSKFCCFQKNPQFRTLLLYPSF